MALNPFKSKIITAPAETGYVPSAHDVALLCLNSLLHVSSGGAVQGMNGFWFCTKVNSASIQLTSTIIKKLGN